MLFTQKMFGPNHKSLFIGQYSSITVSMQIIITIPMQILATVPSAFSHYSLQTANYERGQLMLKKVWTGQQMLQGWNWLFLLHQMHPSWCSFYLPDSFLHLFSFFQNLWISSNLKPIKFVSVLRNNHSIELAFVWGKLLLYEVT